jgi:hypothetical protein
MKPALRFARIVLMSSGLLLSLGSLAQPDPVLELLSARMEELSLNHGFQVQGIQCGRCAPHTPVL